MPHAQIADRSRQNWACLAGVLQASNPLSRLPSESPVGVQDGVNLLEGFSQGSGPTPAPEEAFLAGILHHMPALQTFTTPSPLSYERLKPCAWSGAYQ